MGWLKQTSADPGIKAKRSLNFCSLQVFVRVREHHLHLYHLRIISAPLSFRSAQKMSDFCPENRLSDNAKKLEIDYESKATIKSAK